jgi:predicted RNase H-like nuclease (RuvC/YqgF family)
VCVGIWGVCFAGQRDAEAQSLAQKLAESNRRAAEYIAQQQSDISKLKSNIEQLGTDIKRLQDNNQQLKNNNIELERNNRKLIESEKARRENDLEAIRIIESADHR